MLQEYIYFNKYFNIFHKFKLDFFSIFQETVIA